MNWEEKFEIMKNMTHTEICMRKPSDWYISSWMNIAGGSYGEGHTPEEAINNQWELMTTRSFEISSWKHDGKEYLRWNGFLFVRISEEEYKRDFRKEVGLV
jgi:hypothetical protein